MAIKVKEESTLETLIRERRPFLWLGTVEVPQVLPQSVTDGLTILNQMLDGEVALLVRSLVNHTVTSQNEWNRRKGRQVGVSLSVLNRRRRAARAWINSILSGQVDRATLHAVANSWLPQLCGTGPSIRRAQRPARRYFEFLRGLISSHIVREPAANMVPEAKALHAMETILGIHLQALVEAIRMELAREPRG